MSDPQILTAELPARDDVPIDTSDLEVVSMPRGDLNALLDRAQTLGATRERNSAWAEARRNYEAKAKRAQAEHDEQIAELAAQVLRLANRFSGASGPLDNPTAPKDETE